MPRCQAPGPDVPAEAWSLVPGARGWDLNPRDRKPGPTVFETAAFGRSATPPKSGIRHQAPGSRIFSGWCLVPGT